MFRVLNPTFPPDSTTSFRGNLEGFIRVSEDPSVMLFVTYHIVLMLGGIT